MSYIKDTKNFYMGLLILSIFGVLITALILLIIFKGFLSAIKIALVFILLVSVAIAFISCLKLIHEIWSK